MDSIRFRLRIYLTVLVVVMAVSTLMFMKVEGLPFLDAFYFSIVTVATVGYGDVHATTPAGKLIAICLIVIGVGTFLGVVANATEMMLNRRETQARMKKMNMLIGVFFSEVGTTLLARFSDHDPDLDQIRSHLVITTDWSDQNFLQVSNSLKNYRYSINIHTCRLDDLKKFILHKREFLVRLLENPLLIEHESFTDLLRAAFHLSEELACRDDVNNLPDMDKNHISGDIKRVYKQLVHQWLDYMHHQKKHYPYLFSLSMRTNPFDREASPIFQG